MLNNILSKYLQCRFKIVVCLASHLGNIKFKIEQKTKTNRFFIALSINLS